MIIVNLKRDRKEILNIDIDKVESYKLFAGIASLKVDNVIYMITNIAAMQKGAKLCINGIEISRIDRLIDEITSTES